MSKNALQTKLFGIDDFPAAKDSGKVLIIIIYCYLIIIIITSSQEPNYVWFLAVYTSSVRQAKSTTGVECKQSLPLPF